MIIPKSACIFGQKWSIEIGHVPDDDDGICIPDDLKIHINKDLSEDDKIQTFFHEVFHAMCSRIGLRQVISHEVEEILAENNATIVTEMLKIMNVDTKFPLR